MADGLGRGQYVGERDLVVDLGEAEVGELDVAALAQQHVVGLDVAVDDAVLVQVVEGDCHLAQVEECHPLVEVVHLVEEGLEVAANHVLHDEEHVLARLQRVEELDDERRLGDGERVTLGSHLLRHVLAHHHALLHHLDGEYLIGIVAVVRRARY